MDSFNADLLFPLELLATEKKIRRNDYLVSIRTSNNLHF
jgi:hypothetical protein